MLMSAKHPRDEFDRDRSTGRRGAHRARPSPVLAAVPLLFVTVAVVAVIVGAMTLLGGNDLGAVDTAAQQALQEAQDAEATGGADPEPTDPAPPSSDPPSSDPPEGAVDTALPVTVLNGTRTSGLATRAAQQLTDAGWQVAGAANYREGDAPPTTVFYADESAAATAAAVAAELGTTATALDPDRADGGLTVVLGEDYSR